MEEPKYQKITDLARKGDIDALLRLAADPESYLYKRKESEKNVLSLLAEADLTGKEETLGQLLDVMIKNGFDINATRSEQDGASFKSATALSDANQKRNVVLMRALFDHGASLHVTNGEDLLGNSISTFGAHHVPRHKVDETKAAVLAIIECILDSGQVDFTKVYRTYHAGYSYLGGAKNVGLPPAICDRIAAGIIEGILAEHPNVGVGLVSPVVQAGANVAGQFFRSGKKIM